jgi:hypothetical protein
LSIIRRNEPAVAISCGYTELNHETLTFHIALRGNQVTADQEFETAKNVILQRTSSPTALADTDQQTFMSDLDCRFDKSLHKMTIYRLPLPPANGPAAPPTT